MRKRSVAARVCGEDFSIYETEFDEGEGACTHWIPGISPRVGMGTPLVIAIVEADLPYSDLSVKGKETGSMPCLCFFQGIDGAEVLRFMAKFR